MTEDNKPTYLVTEDDILKISRFFGCVEDAIKEVLRHRRVDVSQHEDRRAESYLYEETSRVLYKCETDPEVQGSNLEDLF